MIFSLDTAKIEELKITFSMEDYGGDDFALFQDFCFGMASFFTAFAKEYECDTKAASSFKTVCLSCIGRDIDYIIEQGIFEQDATNGIPEDELNDFSERLRAKGFSESEISAYIQLAIDAGSWGAVLRYLKSIAGELGINQ